MPATFADFVYIQNWPVTAVSSVFRSVLAVSVFAHNI